MNYRFAALMMVAVAVHAQPQPSFAVASVKPSNSTDQRPFFAFRADELTANNVTLKRLIQSAYAIKDFQISGGPGWAGSELFDIHAKPESPVKQDQIMPMLQALLAERFQLSIQHSTKEMPVYALVVAKNGPRFKDANEADPNIPELRGGPELPAGTPRPRMSIVRRGRLTSQGADMAGLASQLSSFLGRAVFDRTGLKGVYDLKLEWAPDESQVGNFQAMGVPEGAGAPAADWPGPTLFTALEEQLGLRLDSQRGSVEMFAIERVQRPSSN